MSFIQFVAPLIGGYWFLLTCNYTKFIVKEDSGYHLFFKSSMAAVIFLIVANVTIFIVNFFSDETTSSFLKTASELIPRGFDFTSILAMFIGFALGYVLNYFFYNASKELTRAAEDRGKYLFLMAQEAFEKSMMIEVTLNSGKVYIGSPLSEIPFESEYLRMIPYFSGYREKETKKLIVSNVYAEEIESILTKNQNDDAQKSLQKFRVIILTNEIVSARLFYPEIFQKLSDNK